MIRLLWEPALEGEWTLVLQVCRAFDEEYSFRELGDLAWPEPEAPLDDSSQGAQPA